MGLFSIFKKKEKPAQTKPLVEETVAQTKVSEISPGSPKTPEIKRNRIYVYEMKNGLNKVYQYARIKIDLAETASEIIGEMESANNWSVSFDVSGTAVLVSYNGRVLGTLLDRVDMVRDFIRRNDLVLGWLETNSKTTNTLVLAFYRDERKRLANKESEVVKLTRCLNQEAQDTMIGLDDGVALTLDDDYDYTAPEGTVFVLFGSAMGALPKKQANRYLEEGVAGVFLEYFDYDDRDRQIPYVRIYWN